MSLDGNSATHLPGQSRFEIAINHATAVLEYRIADDSMTIHHTYVPPELRGSGVAAKLADAALAFVNSSELRVIPQCSYIAAYMKRKPE